FNFSQASFTNWAAGGENNLNLITFASIYFRKSTLRYEWENLIDGAYGVQSFRGLDVIRKSEDKLEFTSKIGHKTTETLFTSFLFNLKRSLMRVSNTGITMNAPRCPISWPPPTLPPRWVWIINPVKYFLCFCLRSLEKSPWSWIRNWRMRGASGWKRPCWIRLEM